MGSNPTSSAIPLRSVGCGAIVAGSFLLDVPQTADPSLRPAPAHDALPLSGQAGTTKARPSQTQGRRDFAPFLRQGRRDDSARFFRSL